MRIYHNLTRGSESWRLLHKTFFNENHIDLCNATEVIEDQNLGNIFSMTWRWVSKISSFLLSFFNIPIVMSLILFVACFFVLV